MFKKSSFCGVGMFCVEIDANFKTSSFCIIGACVEVNIDFNFKNFKKMEDNLMFKKSSVCKIMPTCVEVDTNFKTASFCGIGPCVEVDKTTDKKVVAVRHSKNSEIVIVYSRDEWKAFIKGVKNGEFDIED